MPEVPKDIAQWNAACLAKYILKHWMPTYLLRAAMDVMSKGSPNLSNPVLCSYVTQGEPHPNTPPEIIAELKRRASLPS